MNFLQALRAVIYFAGTLLQKRMAAIGIANRVFFQLIFSALSFGSDNNAISSFSIFAAHFYWRIRKIAEFTSSAIFFIMNKTAKILGFILTTFFGSKIQRVRILAPLPHAASLNFIILKNTIFGIGFFATFLHYIITGGAGFAV